MFMFNNFQVEKPLHPAPACIQSNFSMIYESVCGWSVHIWMITTLSQMLDKDLIYLLGHTLKTMIA